MKQANHQPDIVYEWRS